MDCTKVNTSSNNTAKKQPVVLSGPSNGNLRPTREEGVYNSDVKTSRDQGLLGEKINKNDRTF